MLPAPPMVQDWLQDLQQLGVGARVSALHWNILASGVQFPRIKLGIMPMSGREQGLPWCHSVCHFDLTLG